MNTAATDKKGMLGTGKNTHMGSMVEAGAECAGHYKLRVATGHLEGAGGASGSPIPTCLANPISSLHCTHARQTSKEGKQENDMMHP